MSKKDERLIVKPLVFKSLFPEHSFENLTNQLYIKKIVFNLTKVPLTHAGFIHFLLCSRDRGLNFWALTVVTVRFNTIVVLNEVGKADTACAKNRCNYVICPHLTPHVSI